MACKLKAGGSAGVATVCEHQVAPYLHTWSAIVPPCKRYGARDEPRQAIKLTFYKFFFHLNIKMILTFDPPPSLVSIVTF